LRYDLLGPRLGNDVNLIAEGLKNIDSDIIARKVISEGYVDIEGFKIAKEELNIQIEDISHYSSIYENNYVVSLDTILDKDLINEGMAREFVHNVQNIRKELGFNIEDRITIEFQTDDELTKAIEQFEKYISSETLSLSITHSNIDNSRSIESNILGKSISFYITKVN
jgi:isoleucyl-tRNA synthetase